MQYKTKFLHLIHMEECNTDDTRLLEYKLYMHTKVHVFIIDLLGIFCSVRSKTEQESLQLCLIYSGGSRIRQVGGGGNS